MDTKIKAKELFFSPQFIFTVIALIFGLLFMFITPPIKVPDEHTHILRTCEVADGILYNKTPPKETNYDKYFVKLTTRTENFHLQSGYSPILYIPSALSLKVSSLLTENENIIFYFGRFLNLLSYILLCIFAIKITPIFKYPFMFTALLPMALYEGMSYSADSFNNGFAFLFFAYIFKLIYEEKELTKTEYINLGIFTIIGALCKGLIYPLFLFFFLPIKDKKIIKVFAYIILGITLCLLWRKINFVAIHPYYPVANDNLLLFKEPLFVINKFFTTTITFMPQYISSCIGVFSLQNLYMPSFVYVATSIVYLSQFILLAEEKVFKTKIKITAISMLILFYFSTLYVMLNVWTPFNARFIYGVQGRYFISILPLFFLCLTFKPINTLKKYTKVSKIFIISFIVLLLSISSLWLYGYFIL